MEDCTEEDCTAVVANSTSLTREEKRLWLGTIRGLQRLHLAGLERDKVLNAHVTKEESYWVRMEPLIKTAERWEARRKWFIRSALVVSALIAWALDLGHHAIEIWTKYFRK